MLLLKEPLLLSTLNRTPRAEAIISLVLVLPFEPVTATTGILNLKRWNWAILPNASTVFSTAITGISRRLSNSALASTHSWFKSKACARFSCALSKKSCPSNFNPFIAIKSSPFFTLRESVDMPLKCRSGPPNTTLPFVALIISFNVNIVFQKSLFNYRFVILLFLSVVFVCKLMRIFLFS